jgi:anaerobic dimethyl sulfoxide reductase subunit B (iron-sulfur subunit)
MSQQYGFYFDAGRCIKCHTCEMACKVTNNLETGISWRQVIETWSGNYPDVTRTFFSKSCMHCEKPSCLEVCPTGAIWKRAEDGIVMVDKDKCNGCRDCLAACPYDVPQFGKDGKMQKCDYCTGAGREPACTESCPASAIYSGTLDTLLETAKGKNPERMDGDNIPSIILVGYKS